MDPAGPPTRGDGGGSRSGPGAERVGIREPSPVSDSGLLRNQTGRDPDSGGGAGRGSERIDSGTGPGRSLRGGIVAALSEGRKPGGGAVGADEDLPSVPSGLHQFHVDGRIPLQRGREGRRGRAGGHSDHAWVNGMVRRALGWDPRSRSDILSGTKKGGRRDETSSPPTPKPAISLSKESS